ncbi:MAG: rubredoxin [Clostridia bacterium]|nr:rubredoxin [Clostridia bacterium]
MRYICQICGYVYDDAKEKIPFEALSDDWKCPLCGAVKADFKPEEAAKPEVAKAQAAFADADLKKLSPGQLSALCSNLARGCEKQYKSEEAGLFRELAEYFASITPAIPDAAAEDVAALLQADIDRYAGVRAVADEAGDRGAARVCVWGEKVTRMLSSLVNRYLKEGEAMLADTDIWVCTVCGFVYVGDEAPQLCPVCKVPAWKFEKIEGRAKG